MPENILYNLFYALVSGFTEFFGVDAPAHQRMFELLTGREQTDAVLALALRFGLLLSLLVSCWPRLRRLNREQSYSSRSRRLKRQTDPIAHLDLKLLRTAALPACVSVLFYAKGAQLVSGFLPLALVLLLNAAVLFVPRVINAGNKDGRSVSRIDGILIGCSSFLSAVPGFSRVGAMLTAGAVGGLDRGYALDMALLLSIPVLVGLLVFDVIAVIAAKAAITLTAIAFYLLYAAVAFLGGWVSIVLMRYLSLKIGFTGFAYYSLGLALFSLIFYLVI